MPFVVDKPYAAPGQCKLCGSGTKKQYLDTEIQIEFYGVLYICDECFAPLAYELDYISCDEVRQIRTSLELLEVTNNVLKRRLKTYERIFAEARDLDDLRKLSDPLDSVADILVPDSPTDEGASDGQDSVGSGEAESTESLDEQGVVNVSTGSVTRPRIKTR